MPFEFPEVVPETALTAKLLGRKDSSWLQSEASEIESPITGPSQGPSLENIPAATHPAEQTRRPALWVFPAHDDEAGKLRYNGLSKEDPETGLLEPALGTMPAQAPESPQALDTGADGAEDCKTEQAELGVHNPEDCETKQAELGVHDPEDSETKQAELGREHSLASGDAAPIPAPAILKRLPPISPAEQSALSAAGKHAADEEADEDEKPKRSNRGRGGRGRGRGRSATGRGRGRGRGRRVDEEKDDISEQPEDVSMEEETAAEPPAKRRAVAKCSPKTKAKAKAKGKSKPVPKATCRRKAAVEEESEDAEDATCYHGSPLAAAPGTPESVHEAKRATAKGKPKAKAAGLPKGSKPSAGCKRKAETSDGSAAKRAKRGTGKDVAESDDALAAKQAKSRKSVAYHAARKAAKERGLSDEAAKEEAKLVSCLDIVHVLLNMKRCGFNLPPSAFAELRPTR